MDQFRKVYQSKSVVTASSTKDQEDGEYQRETASQEDLSVSKRSAEKYNYGVEAVSEMKEVPVLEKSQEVNNDGAGGAEGSCKIENVVSEIKNTVPSDENLTAEEAAETNIGEKEAKTEDSMIPNDKDQEESKRVEDELTEKEFEEKNEVEIAGNEIDDRMVDSAASVARTENVCDNESVVDNTLGTTIVVEAVIESAVADAEAVGTVFRDVRHSTETDDSSDPYTDVPNEDEEEQDEEEKVEEVEVVEEEVGEEEEEEKHDAGNRYVPLKNESPQNLPTGDGLIRRISEDDMKDKEETEDNHDQGSIHIDL